MTYDKEFMPGLNSLAAVKDSGRLKLYVNGKLVATSTAFNPSEYDLLNQKRFTIGFGARDYFNGSLGELRLYDRALADTEVLKLSHQR